MPTNCLLINGSSRGSHGNSARLIRIFKSLGTGVFEFRELNLIETGGIDQVLPLLEWAESFVFATGTYWDSWGWPLQRFLESATKTEGSPLWLGKPAAVLVTMHSVGGKGVLSRLQGVLNTMGASLPPMSGVVISAVGQQSLMSADPELANDIWRVEDLKIVAANLHCAAVRNRMANAPKYQSWDVDRTGFENVWLQD